MIYYVRYYLRQTRKALAKPTVRVAAWVLAWIYKLYMGLVWHTSRVEAYGMARAVAAVNRHRNILVAVWHDNVILAPRCCRIFSPTTLASRSDIGDVITAVLKLQNYHVFRGGSSRGRSRRTPILQQLVKYLNEREEVVLALTVDGSTGPARILKPGIIGLSHDTGAPIFAAHIACRPMFRLRSWDRTRVPLPFGRIVMVVEGPIHCSDRELDADEFQRLRALAQRLLEDTADRAERCLAGEPLPEPDPELGLDPSYGDRSCRPGKALLTPDEPPPNPRLRSPQKGVE